MDNKMDEKEKFLKLVEEQIEKAKIPEDDIETIIKLRELNSKEGDKNK